MNRRRGGSAKAVPHLALQAGRETVLDETDALLLRRVSEPGSLTSAARLVGISYRNAWGRIRKMESKFVSRILQSSAGGVTGGGSSLTPEALSLMREFRRMRKYLFDAIDDQESAGNVRYRLSARNQFRVKVIGIERGDITSMIRMASAAPIELTSIISNDAVDDLGLAEGDEVDAVVKSTEVMIAKRDRAFVRSRSRR